MKNLENACESCGAQGCDRMMLKDDLDEGLDEAHDGNYLENDRRRYMMYGLYIRIRYGRLRVGNRRTIQVCCAKLIRLHFPLFDGYTGFQVA